MAAKFSNFIDFDYTVEGGTTSLSVVCSLRQKNFISSKKHQKHLRILNHWSSVGTWKKFPCLFGKVLCSNEWLKIFQSEGKWTRRVILWRIWSSEWKLESTCESIWKPWECKFVRMEWVRHHWTDALPVCRFVWWKLVASFRAGFGIGSPDSSPFFQKKSPGT